MIINRKNKTLVDERQNEVEAIIQERQESNHQLSSNYQLNVR